MKKLLVLNFFLAYCVGTLFVLTMDRRFDAQGGDDANLSYSQKMHWASSSLSQCLVEAQGSKWRPVTSLVNYGAYSLFGGDARAYVFLNIGAHALSAAFIALCVHLLMLRAGRTWGLLLFPAIAACCYAFQGFSYYNFTQRYGLMEELCVLFTAMMLCLACMRGFDLRRMSAVFVLLALSCLTHERFVALAVFASLFPFLATELPKMRRLWLACVPWLIVGLYLLIKGPVLKAGLLMGTGDQNIELDIFAILPRCFSVINNILAYNNGPIYLSAYQSQSFLMYISLGVLAVCVGCTVFFARRLHKDALGAMVLIFGSALLPLVFVASICYRVEFRWILSPWVVFLLWFFALYLYAGQVGHRLLRWLLSCSAVVWLSLSCYQSLKIRRDIDNLFFMQWQMDAETLKDCLERHFYLVYEPVPIFFATPCSETLQRDFLSKKFKVVTAEEMAKMTEVDRAKVMSLRRFYCGWSYEVQNGPATNGL